MPEETDCVVGLRRHLRIGGLVLVLFGGGLVGGSAAISIDGAVIAEGAIVLDTNLRSIQHPTGGVVAEIAVRDGDMVEAGDVLVRLDETQTRAGLAMISARLDELGVRRARLLVERDGGDGLVLPAALAARATEPALAETLRGEERLLHLRREAQASRIAQLEEQIVQLRQEVAGFEAQAVAKTREREMVQRELEGVRDLFARGLVPLTRLAGLERDDARIEAEAAALVTAAAQARGRIGETRLAILQTEQDARSDAARQLRETEALVAEETERAVAARDALDRVVLRAPRAGTVHRLAVHTVGGVVGPGDVLMTLVPRNDELAVDVRIAPTEIDRVAPGLPVVLRFSAFDQRTTPEVSGTVTRVSPDLVTDARTGVGAYIARVRIDTETQAALADRTLVPGMPVEAFVRTGERTLLAHLTKPFADHLARAFRHD